MLALGTLLLAQDAYAAPKAPVSKVSPRVRRAIETGILGSSRGRPRRPGAAPVLVELDAPVTPAMLDALRAAGVELTDVDGETIAYDRFVPAHVGGTAATALETMPGVHRVALLSGAGPLPLDHSAALTGLADARGSHPALDLLTGTGVKIADDDTMVDPFQPTFFRGDAGYFDWIDVDHDGVFTPGVDAIDLNGNGVADPGETAQVVAAATVDFYGMPQAARTADFDPSVDWLYLDTNGNGVRDYGAANGFDDTTPAFGEPLFVPDDVNQNGKLDVGERVVRLGTSKFDKIYVRLADTALGLAANHVYQRGTDLSKVRIDYSKGALYGYDDAFHATGVNTIIAGDVPLVGRRWVGFAPDADLFVAWDEEDTQGLPAAGATWALTQTPDVMLYETAPWTGDALDGSDPLSTLIDSAPTVTHTCPTGDESSAGKHTSASLAAGGNMALAFIDPAAAPKGYPANQQHPVGEVEVSLDITGGLASSVTVMSGAGDVVPFDLTQAGPFTGTLANGSLYYTTVEVTPRGTQFVDAIFYAATTPPVDPPAGNWSAKVTAQTALHVDAYVNDDISGWGVGVEWDASIANDTSLIGMPAVADHCIAVGAFPDHVATSTEPWYDMYYAAYNVPATYAETQYEVRAYSPLGPRIDGVQKPDLLAPDNPWVACDGAMGTYPKPYGSFTVFGGTSGAAPHVTGVAALLAQAGIRGDAARSALRGGAFVDATTGAVPNATYGYGRLNAGGALGVSTPETGAPTIALTFSPESPTTKDTVEITPTVASPNGATGLEVKWDDGYDGTWDTAYTAPAPHALTATTAGKVPVKARVRDAAGHIAEAVVWVVFNEPGMSTSGAGGAASHAMAKGGGCGCRAVGAADDPSAGAAVALLAAAVLVRGRRRR